MNKAEMNIVGVLNMSFKKVMLIGLAGFLLTACESDKSTKLQDSLDKDSTVDVISNLDFGESVIPFPNNILFIDALGMPPADGTLQIPVDDETALSDPAVAMNALDGFSTVAPISTGFTGALDDSSFSSGVKMYEVTRNAAGAVISVDRELTFGTEFIATLSSIDSTMSTLVILPLQPLKPKQTYMPVVTNSVKSASGRAVGISASYLITHGLNPLHTGGISNSPLLSDAQAQQLEPLRQATVAAETALEAFDGTVSADIIISWNFTTQSTTDVLSATRVQNRALTTASGFGPTGATSPLGAADINAGSLVVPYYLKASSTAASPSNDPTALGSCWNGMGAGGAGTCAAGPHTTQFNPAPDPAAGSTEIIPMLVSIPKSIGACASGMPGTGWPIVIYQHGITTSRGTMLAVADAMAGACMAVVAIDMPMHGLTGNETNGTEAFKGVPVSERTFDLDLVTQDSDGNITAAVPDSVIDTSGRHFINLTNLLNTRDNVRQAVSDLFVLVDAIEEGTVTDGANTMDPAKIYFLGHSLGGMVGTVFTALEPSVRDIALAFSGASLPKILDGSASFGPSIAAGLATNGVVKGTADYESFIGAAQTVVDSGDPVNFAVAAATGRGVLFFEIVGGSSSPSDLVVPNIVPDANDTSGTVPAPLAGSEPQIALMGLTHTNETILGVADLKVVTKFISGEHSSLLDPGPDAAVTTEIQSEAAAFFATDGTVLQVTDNTVLQAP